jgi:acetyl esterase
MPHANSGHWHSQIAGRPLNYSRPKSVEELRVRRENGTKMFEDLAVDLPAVGAFHERVTMRPQGSGTPTAEVYVPEGEGPFPVLLHIHGGGWFTGSAKGERKLGMQICGAGFVVVNIDYALAPEHPFPQGLQDCLYAARWIVCNIAKYKGDPRRLAIGGGSAGGNLTMCTALALHGSDEGLDGADLAGVSVRFQAAVPQFGVLDVPRWIHEPHYYAGASELYLMSYLGASFTDRIRHPLVSPIHNPHLAKLPPVYLSCGAEDALLSHSLAMTNALTLLDVPTTLSVVAGADHEFLKLQHLIPGARPELDRITTWLNERLAVEESRL